MQYRSDGQEPACAPSYKAARKAVRGAGVQPPHGSHPRAAAPETATTAVTFECRRHHTSHATQKMTSLRTPVTARPPRGGRPWPLTRGLTRAVTITGRVRPARWRHLRP